MNRKSLKLTLEAAKEWYNSDDKDLKRVALEDYTEQELTGHDYTDIKTFEDAVDELSLNFNYVTQDIESFNTTEGEFGNHLKAIYKLNIIHKALNGDWNFKMTEGRIYYPLIRVYPADKSEEATEIWGIVRDKFIAEDREYVLIAGYYNEEGTNGLLDYDSVYDSGNVWTSPGLFGCKNSEIAEHMSKYFSKEIFEACYARHFKAYRWI